MTQWWFAFWQRNAKMARALRTIPHLECLEERNLLTNGLVVVPNPPDAGQSMSGAAAVAANDIWGVGSNEFIDPTTGAIDLQPLAEHFNGQSWSVVSTPLVASGGPIPPTAKFYGVAAAASNDVWAVGFRFGPDNPDNGESLIENWNGSSWSVVPSPTSTVENTLLKAVAAISPSNVWAVGGNAGNVLVEHFDGKNWSVVHSPVFGSGEGTAISADSADDIWGVDSGTFLHFNGTKWSSVASAIGIGSGTTSVTALSPTDVWAAGTVPGGRTGGLHPREFGKAAIEHWDGTSWSMVTSPNPNPGGASTLQGIAAISANDIWAVGNISAATTLTEHWDGTSWSIIPSPSPAANQNQLFAVTALSDGTVAAVGHQEDANTDQPLILQNAASAPKTAAATAPLAASAATTGGTSGVPGLVVAPSPQIAGRLNATAAIADNDIWAFGSDQQLGNPTLAEHFNGKTWIVVPTPSGINGRFNGVSGVASNDVWAVGTMTGPDNPDFGEQFIEHWNGKSWSVVASPTVEGDALNSVVAISANNVWAVGAIAPEGAKALVEHWDGTSWSIVSNSVIAGAGRLSSVSADSANDVWAVGQATLPLHFNGTSWSQTPGPPVAVEANAVVALSPTDVWAVGKKQADVNHLIRFTTAIEHWNGTSWSNVASPTTSINASLNGIAAISANDILAVGAGTSTTGASTTLVEQWNGTSWSILSSPNPGDFANGLSAVTALSDGTVAAVGFQESATNGFSPLILQNAASAPQTAAATAPVAASAATVGGMRGASLTPGSGSDDQTRALPAAANTAAVDQFFAAVGEVDQQLWLLSSSLETRHTAANANLDVFSGDT